MNISACRASVLECNGAIYAIKSSLQSLLSEQESLVEKIKNSQSIIDNKQNVMAVLDGLNDRTQARTKSVYENLLTTLLHEVKPDDPENDSVVLETEIKKNKVSLDVGVRTSSGFVRNAYQDKGRSVENILAMGLRFISVSRTSNRRLIVMDEADNNLRQEYIPAFARIMAQLSRQIGMQVIYISHHPASCFEGHARIISFERINGRVVSGVVSEPSMSSGYDSKASDSYIRYIRLVNTKQHENTFIELSPGVNVITADIDVGKSTLAQAIEAVAQNEGREGLIRDGETALLVEMGIEGNMVLRWEYSRKGSRKTKYTLIDGSGAICNESYDGQYVPAWLHDYLGMEKKHDFDIHISDSHNSSFILDKKISSFKRADLLSLGRESADVQKMLRAYAEMLDKATKTLNESKKRLELVHKKIEVAKGIEFVGDKIGGLEDLLTKIEVNYKKMDVIKDIGAKMACHQDRLNALSKINGVSIPSVGEINWDAQKISKIADGMLKLDNKLNALSPISGLQLPAAPAYTSPEKLIKVAGSMHKMSEMCGRMMAINDVCIPSAPTVKNVDNCIVLADKIGRLSKRIEIMKIPDISGIIQPEYKSPNNIAIAGKNIDAASKLTASLFEKIIEKESEHKECIHEKSKVIDLIGGKCPLCEQMMPRVEVA